MNQLKVIGNKCPKCGGTLIEFPTISPAKQCDECNYREYPKEYDEYAEPRK
jgi:hypothetical protein